MGRMNENNKVTVCGVLSEEFMFSHEAYGDRFYKSYIAVKRKSGVIDYVPIMVSYLIAGEDISEPGNKGRLVEVIGSFRSYNEKLSGKKSFEFFVFADRFTFYGDDEVPEENNIYAKGFIRKPVVYRETPSGREVSHFLLFVDRPSGVTDRIPCIVWGRNAVFAKRIKAGSEVSIKGRIQSRERIKRIDEEAETRITYDISSSEINVY